jgi:uncharacterized protein YeeX (DUF496 family)
MRWYKNQNINTINKKIRERKRSINEINHKIIAIEYDYSLIENVKENILKNYKDSLHDHTVELAELEKQKNDILYD